MLLVREKEFYRKVFQISIPIALQSLITIAINLVDTMMLGRLGETAISGSALANQFVNVFQILCMGMGMGASVLVSRFYGQGDYGALRKAVTIMYRFCLVIAALFTAATLLFPQGVMRIYTAEEAVVREGAAYLEWMFPGYLLLGFSLTTTLTLRSVKKVTVPLLSSVSGLFLNIFFNYCLIFGKMGFPRLEIRGAALATMISRFFECAVICGYFWFVEKEVGYRLRHFFLRCGNLVREYFRVSFPVLVSDGLLALGNNAVAMVIGRMGESYVAANAITVMAQQLSTVLVQGISQASAILTGHTLGEGDVEKAQRQGYTFFFMGAVLGVLAGGFIIATSEIMIGFYNVSEGTREIARQLMNAIGVITFFLATNSILTKGVLRGGGDTRFLMVADILFLWVVSVPLGAMAGLVWKLPAFWVYFLLKADQVLKAVWCVQRLRSRKWIKAIHG
ncbi:MAG: MATE family efflux transporter [Oscillospiraceae bacterium]|nr:MATE family efflux transporter [Oscillospiraceae bacterium]